MPCQRCLDTGYAEEVSSAFLSALSLGNCKLELLLSVSLGHNVPTCFGILFEVLPCSEIMA